jgi:uncharacterized membrane protein HdeD (DUF308 family)
VVLTLGVIAIIVGIVLVVAGAFAPVPPQLSQIGWALFVLGVILVLVALLLSEVDHHDHAAVLRSSWGLLLMWPGLRRGLRA